MVVPGGLFRRRALSSVLVAATKIFFGGCCWQVMGLLADNVWKIGGGQHKAQPYETTAAFAVLTGIGDAMGVFLGHAILTAIEAKFMSKAFCGLDRFLRIAGALSTGCILSGGAWQGLTDLCAVHHWPFTAAMLFVGACCGSFFFVGFTAGRAIFSIERATQKDFTLSLSCGLASGFFVGTDARYPNNWLQIIVGERNGHDALDIFKAGLSTFLGFSVSQIFLSAFVPKGRLWTDDDDDEKKWFGGEANDPLT